MLTVYHKGKGGRPWTRQYTVRS